MIYLEFLLVEVDAFVLVCGLLGMNNLDADVGLDEVGLAHVSHTENEVELAVLLSDDRILREHHRVGAVLCKGKIKKIKNLAFLVLPHLSHSAANPLAAFWRLNR